MPLSKKLARDNSLYLSPKELAIRWQCSRSSVDRIALRVKLSRFYLGQGRNGLVRYLRKEVEKFEQSCCLNIHQTKGDFNV